ncbi:hypothetical protein FQN54_004997 [Arachnomyces sp. PD_36]|nr:hypothetical protein FQN54_004997 [Arachnomyces sp. PD_36]
MPTLAIAGGTSPSLGRAITTALLSSSKTSDWNAVILSRSARIPLWLQAVDPDGKRAEIRVVDYLNQESLASALKDVHTVLSVTSAIDGTQAQIQINLVNAAVTAGCKRFAPSQWSFGPVAYQKIGALKMGFEGVWEECMKHKDKIECARFNNGAFMNYLGHGIYPVDSKLDEEAQLQKLKDGKGYMDNEDQACQGLSREGGLEDDSSGAYPINFTTGIAEFPVNDDGKWPRICMTSLKDVGSFVVASLTLPKWEENMTMVGDMLPMNELLSIAEDVTGKKFQVKFVKKEELEAKMGKLVLPNDFLDWMWTDIKLAYSRDEEGEVVLDPVVNRLCPEVRPVTVREYIERHWKREWAR